MYKTNLNFSNLQHRYLFGEIVNRTTRYAREHPQAKIIKMGIGDVTKPLPPFIIEAMHRAVEEYTRSETFHGYGPEVGYDFLRQAIVDDEYCKFGIGADEIFISDGINSDICNFGELFSNDNVVGITDPVYPAYFDSNIIKGNEIRLLPCKEENGFKEEIPTERIDIVYLCYPNNPTGVALTRDELARWVDYALRNKSLILFDGAYEAFIREDNVPHSIYEIEGAKRCAVEFRSFSKSAGFTGIRCAYTVVPKELGDLNAMWNRRQNSKYNGTSYISQRGAQASLTPEGKRQIRENIDYYLENAKVIRDTVERLGMKPTGGINSPYIWAKIPDGMDSWAFFDLCLEKANIVITPGSGFGVNGEGYVRFSAFGERDNAIEGMNRLSDMLCKK